MKFGKMISGSLGGQSSVTSADSSYIATEAKKEISERLMTTEEFQELGSGSRRKTLGEMLSLHSPQKSPRSSHYSSRLFRKETENGRHDSSSAHSSVNCSSKRGYTPMKELQQGNTLDSSSKISVGGLAMNSDNLGEAGAVGSCYPSEISAMDSPMKESAASKNSLKADEMTEFLEADDVSLASHSSVGSESFKSMEEVYQPSLNSEISSEMLVLPYELEASDDCLGGHHLTFSSQEEEDDDDEQSVGNFGMGKFMRFSKPEESRDFSYLVDVLSEAGLQPTESFIKWHSEESPIDSSVFDVLEKKYGEQKSWRRSERKLLFDRINLGLVENLVHSISVPSWAKPVSTRVMGTKITEEAIRALLIRQEIKVRKESENVLGDDLGWSDLGECVEYVSREIENVLVEEITSNFL